MRILELRDYIQEQIEIPFYPLAFPSAEQAPAEAGTVQYLTSYTKSKGGTQKVNVQMIVRSIHPERAEDLGLTLVKHFTGRTDFRIGSTQVIFCDLRTPFPLFVGKDNAGHFRYSVTMVLLLNHTS